MANLQWYYLNLYLFKNVEDIVVFLDCIMNMHSSSVKAFEGTFVNWIERNIIA